MLFFFNLKVKSSGKRSRSSPSCSPARSRGSRRRSIAELSPAARMRGAKDELEKRLFKAKVEEKDGKVIEKSLKFLENLHFFKLI